MSLTPMLWAMKAAPVADTTEKLILISLAERADEDGCDAFPSKATLATDALCDEKTVQRKIKKLTERKLIGLGDQRAAQYIERRYRPKVYDLLIPFNWFPDIHAVNENRRQRGRAPLTPDNRPDIEAAPARAQRSDKGKPRPKNALPERRGDSVSPLNEAGTAADSGGTDSPARGDSQSQQGGLTDPQTSPVEPPLLNLPGAPSARSATERRRPTTGGHAREQLSGSAATNGATAPKDKARQMLVSANVKQVLDAYHPDLMAAMRQTAHTDRPKSLVSAIERQLEATGEVKRLVARIQRRWSDHRYAELFATGELKRPVGAATKMVGPGPCSEPMCEDGTIYDTGAPCRSCSIREQDRKLDQAREREAAAKLRACPYCERDAGSNGQPCRECRASIESAERDVRLLVNEAVTHYAALSAESLDDRERADGIREHLDQVIERARSAAAAEGANPVGQALAARLAAQGEAHAVEQMREEASNCLAAPADRRGHSPAIGIPAQLSSDSDRCPGHDGKGCHRPALGSEGLCTRCRTITLQAPATTR